MPSFKIAGRSKRVNFCPCRKISNWVKAWASVMPRARSRSRSKSVNGDPVTEEKESEEFRASSLL